MGGVGLGLMATVMVPLYVVLLLLVLLLLRLEVRLIVVRRRGGRNCVSDLDVEERSGELLRLLAAEEQMEFVRVGLLKLENEDVDLTAVSYTHLDVYKRQP